MSGQTCRQTVQRDQLIQTPYISIYGEYGAQIYCVIQCNVDEIQAVEMCKYTGINDGVS